MSIKTISNKNQNFLAPKDYVHLFSEKVLESTTGLTTLFIMPSSNDILPNNTNNIQYMLPGIKTSSDNNYFGLIGSDSSTDYTYKKPPLGFTHLKYGDSTEFPEYKMRSSIVNDHDWYNIPLYYKDSILDLFKVHQDFSDHTNDKIGINVDNDPQYTLDVNGSIRGNELYVKKEISNVQVFNDNSTISV